MLYFWCKTSGSDEADGNGAYSNNAKGDSYYNPNDVKKNPRRKMEPPWMEQV